MAEPAPSPSPWTRVGRLADLAEDRPHASAVGDVELVLVRRGATVRAFEGACPHQGALLGEGELEDGQLVCRAHRWRFDAATGHRLDGDGCLRACPVRVDGDEVLVDPTPLLRTDDPPPAARPMESLPGPRGLPLVGSALALDVTRLHACFEAWAAEHGPLYRLKLGPQRVVVSSDPALNEAMLRARPDRWRRPTKLERIFEELGIAGVFSAEGTAWRPQRRLAMEALSQRHLRGFYPTLHQVTRRLVARLGRAADAGEAVDLQDVLMRFTVDVTTNLAFGTDLDTLGQGEDVIQREMEVIFPGLNRRLNALVPLWRVVRSPVERRLEAAVDAVEDFLGTLIDETRARLDAEPARAAAPSNFLEAMLSAVDEDGRPFSREVVSGNAMTMLLAGEDTTANTLAWAVHELLDAPDAAARLAAEADAVLGAAEVAPDLDRAGQLAVALAVAQETMRLRPVAPLLFLEPIADEVLGDVLIPKGTMVVALTRAPVLDPTRFGAPLEFRPERWLGAPTGPHDAAAHLPFGSGPRICPGRGLALIEMRVVLASLARAFTFERVGPRDAVTEIFAFTMAPRDLSVRVRRRS